LFIQPILTYAAETCADSIPENNHIRHTKLHSAEPLALDAGFIEIEIDIENLIKFWIGVKVGGKVLQSEIHKVINSV